MNKAIFSSIWRVATALVLTLSLVLVMAAPSMAAVTAEFNPDNGPVGQVIAVTGAGWTGNETITGVGNVTVGGANALYTLTVDATGVLTGNITVPTLTGGRYDIVITGSASGTHTWTRAFLVTAAATFTPITGPVGQVITVTGTGWTASETISAVTVGGATATTHTLTVVSGNLTGTITVPALTGGAQAIVITGTASGAQTFSSAFTVTAAATFTPISGPVGTLITVTGTGWTGNETIAGVGNVTVGGANATYSLTVLNGALSGNITVPTLAVGLQTIVITGATSGAQTFPGNFTVTAAATFTPITGSVGTVITVTGTGWTGNETISGAGNVTVGGANATYTLIVLNGALSGNITVPTLAVGAKDISIIGSSSGNQTFTGAFTVTTALDPTTLTKYLDPLVIPPEMAPTTPGGTHYEIGVWQIQQQVLPSDYPALTTVWGYGANQTTANYPGYTIEATKGVPITVRWTNNLVYSNGTYIQHPLAVDQTLHWADPLMQMFNFNPYTGPVPLVTHLHGGEVESASDGGPNAWFTPGFAMTGAGWVKETYDYPNEQPPTTLWYHDHALGITRLNVYMGLAGFYLLRDPAVEAPLNLPGPAPQIGDASGTVYREIPIAIQDRSFNTDGSLAFPTVGNIHGIHPVWNPEFFGDTIVVNGIVWPYLNVEPMKYRFRFLDGSNARFYSLKLIYEGNGTAGPAFNQIGSDGGYLATPVLLNDPGNVSSPRLTIAPGERADVIIDFSGIAPGPNFILDNNAVTPFPSGNPVDANTAQIMQFRVVASTGNDTSTIPASLNTIVPLTGAKLTRSLTLNEVLVGGLPEIMVLDGKKWGAPITEQPEYGTTEIWEFINLTMDTHPMHLHLVQFQLVSRQAFDVMGYTAAYDVANPVIPVPVGGNYTPVDVTPYLYPGAGNITGPDPNEAGWKDTVQSNPGEVTRIIARFTPTGSAPGTTFGFDPTAGSGYVWHCHIIDHEDNEMMRPFQVMMRTTVVAGGNQTVYQGALVTVNATFTDPDTADTHTASIDWGDGNVTVGLVSESLGSGNVTGSHSYYDIPSNYTATVTVVDNWGGIGLGSLQVSVLNAAPVVTCGLGQSIAQGGNATLSATFTDVGTSDTHTASINWGDGNVTAGSVSESVGSGNVTGIHSYSALGNYTATITVTDNWGASGNCSMQVSVLNAAPVLGAIGNKIAGVQTLLTFVATATDADIPAQTLSFSLANGIAGAVPAGAAITVGGNFTWTPAVAQGNTSYTFDVVVSDTLLLTDSETITVTVTETIALQSGWNFISVPKRMAAAKDTFGELLAGIGVGAAYSYDPAGAGLFVALLGNSTVAPLEGYWIFVINAAGNITLPYAPQGQTVPPSKVLTGDAWNAIGHSSTGNLTAGYTLVSIAGSWSTLLGWNAATQVYDAAIIEPGTGASDWMVPGKGYWIWMRVADTLSAISG